MQQNALPVSPVSGPSTTYYDLVDQFSIEYKVNEPSDPCIDFVHYHECFEVVFYVQSDNLMYVEDECHSLQSHDLLIIPPRRIHTLRYHAGIPYSRYVMYFTAQHVLEAFPQELAHQALNAVRAETVHKLSLSLDEFSRLNSLFKSMTHHSRHHKEEHMSLIESYSRVILEEIYYILQKEPAPAHGDEQKNIVEQLLQYLNAHFKEQIQLEDLESAFFLNKFYLCRLFRENMNSSIMNYLQFKRIIEAQKLLNNTSMSIIDICFECGFNNIQHFYRTFKKITSLTPRQFRSGNKLSVTQSIKGK